MQEEQRIILRMLEEGKISAAEAEALLNALGDSGSQQETGPQEDPWVRLEKLGEDFASKVEVATERFARSLEHRTEGLGEKLSKMLAKVPFVGQEETQEFRTVIQGPVRTSEESLPISIANANGPIKVKGWDKQTYQLTIVQRLRGKERELLRSRLYVCEWVDGVDKNSFELQVPALDGIFISLELFVPQQQLYSIGLSSHNGSLALQNLVTTTTELDTINGSTKVDNVRAETIQGKNGNGSCELVEVEAKKIQHKVGNGSYRLAVAAEELDCVATNGSFSVVCSKVGADSFYNLRTTNGSIRVSLPPLHDVGVALDLKTAVGRISTELGSLELVSEERSGGGTKLSGRSAGFEQKPFKLNLQAGATAGSIVVRRADA